jgi:hypothetical protein
MSSFKYDFVVVGRWRNRAKVEETLHALREAGKKVYCFIEHEYDGDGIKFETHAEADPEKMVAATESLTDWRANPTFRKIFETDMQGLREAEKLVLVFPAGLSAHMELGVAYGMGRPCYAVGEPEKTEPLYFMFDEIFPEAKSLVESFV